MSWVCPGCRHEAINPAAHAAHTRGCKKKPPVGWDSGWQMDTLPVAGRLNVPTEFSPNRTPPGQVLMGWRDWKPRR